MNCQRISRIVAVVKVDDSGVRVVSIEKECSLCVSRAFPLRLALHMNEECKGSTASRA